MAAELPEGAHLNPIIRNAYDCGSWHPIAEGAFAYVGRIKCRDRDGIEVALKIVRREFLDVPAVEHRRIVERLQHEYASARRLVSPYIVQPSHLWMFDEDPLFAALEMELVDGETLAAYLKRNSKMPLETAAKMAHALFSGLAAAHAQEIIHRDIHPPNILLPASGDPILKITDFGIARTGPNVSLSTDAARTNILYVAPEQWAVPRAPITASVDVYSACHVVYQLLTGKHVFAQRVATGVWHDAIVEHQSKSRTPPRELNPEVPQDINDLILQGLSAEPSARPTAAKLAEAFASLSVVRGATPAAPAKPITDGIAAPSAYSAMPTPSGRTLLVGLALVAAIGLGAWLTTRERSKADAAQPVAAATVPAVGNPVASAAASAAPTTSIPLRVFEHGGSLWLANNGSTVAADIVVRVKGRECERIGRLSTDFTALLPPACGDNASEVVASGRRLGFDGGGAP